MYEYYYFTEVDTALESFLKDKLQIDELDIEDVFTDTQLSKLENRKDYLYVALQFPHFNREKKSFEADEVHIFVCPKYITIINKHNYKKVEAFDQIHSRIPDITDSSFVCFYELVDYVVTKLFGTIARFNSEITQLETDIFENTDQKDLIIDIQIEKKNLINFLGLIHPLQLVIQDLQIQFSKNEKYAERIELLDDSLDKIKKISSSLELSRRHLGILSEANESLMVRATNQSLKTLTVVSLLLFVPNLVFAFFGMNIYLGWFNTNMDWRTTATVVGGTVVLGVGMYIVMKRKKVL